MARLPATGATRLRQELPIPRQYAVGWVEEFGELACKPGSVEDNHSSGMPVTRHLKRPTRPQCGSHL